MSLSTVNKTNGAVGFATSHPKGANTVSVPPNGHQPVDETLCSPLVYTPPGGEAISFPSFPVHAPGSGCGANGEWQATVFFKRRECTLTYSTVKDRLTLTYTNRKGVTLTKLNIPTRLILNFETYEEKESRQHARQTNDTTAKQHIGACDGLQGSPSNARSTEAAHDEIVCTNSRTNSITPAESQSSCGSLRNDSQHSDRGRHGGSSGGGIKKATRQLYYLHHIGNAKGEKKKRVHSLEFTAGSGSQCLEQLFNLVQAVLHRVYPKGPKHLLIFISPKSGQGKGMEVYEEVIKPILHFSRHSIETRLTTRAFDCEDYVANLANPLDSGTVVAAAGGDGMVHELVNGIQRRRMALLEQWRGMCTSSGHACTSPAARGGTHQPPPPQATVTTTTAISAPEPLNSVPNGSTSATTEATAKTTGTGSMSTPMKRENGHSELLSSSISPSVSLSALHMQNHLLMALPQIIEECGWDTLMPMIATIPTGSACGLAKTMGVLSPSEAALALVHLQTCHMDLLNMRFRRNDDMHHFHEVRMSTRRQKAQQSKFDSYVARHREELEQRMLDAHGDGSHLAPHLSDGTHVFDSMTSYAVGAPDMEQRTAFMSLSYGLANDIDHGSEGLRWMGNARFGVFGGYIILRGLRNYPAVMRYLPWNSSTGVKLEKIHESDKMPHPSQIPKCTLREDCPFCREQQTTRGATGCLATIGETATAKRAAAASSPEEAVRWKSRQSQLLGEDDVDFDDENLPWVTIRGNFYNILICNEPDVAQDMIMAPVSHLGDGAIDIVYTRYNVQTGKGGRKEMLQFFNGLQTGAHAECNFCGYVKARAVEVKVDAGFAMSDGEMMPLSVARVTQYRQAVQMVRSQ